MRPALLFIYVILIFPIIAVEVALNPSGSPPPPPFTDPYGYAFRLLPVMLAVSAAWVLVLSRIKSWHLALLMIVQWGSALAAALLVHRDFLSSFLPLGLSVWCLYLQQFNAIVPEHRKPYRRRIATATSVAIWVAVLAWLILMSYAIVVRQEPRWEESTVYNIYDAGWLILLYWSWNRFRITAETVRLVVSPSRIALGDIDLSLIFGASRTKIFHRLLQCSKNGRSLTCVEFHDGEFEALPCQSCKDGDGKASLCSKYKNLYNGILSLRKFLETFRLGTIRSPENKRLIRQVGWRFLASKELEISLQD
jgi:hypothetical protein